MAFHHMNGLTQQKIYLMKEILLKPINDKKSSRQWTDYSESLAKKTYSFDHVVIMIFHAMAHHWIYPATADTIPVCTVHTLLQGMRKEWMFLKPPGCPCLALDEPSSDGFSVSQGYRKSDRLWFVFLEAPIEKPAKYGSLSSGMPGVGLSRNGDIWFQWRK